MTGGRRPFGQNRRCRRIAEQSRRFTLDDVVPVPCSPDTLAMPAARTYRNVFRVLIVQFMDALSLDVRSLKKSCIHIAQPHGRMIPSSQPAVSRRPRGAAV